MRGSQRTGEMRRDTLRSSRRGWLQVDDVIRCDEKQGTARKRNLLRCRSYYNTTLCLPLDQADACLLEGRDHSEHAMTHRAKEVKDEVSSVCKMRCR
jgi:hypothetical protein